MVLAAHLQHFQMGRLNESGCLVNLYFLSAPGEFLSIQDIVRKLVGHKGIRLGRYKIVWAFRTPLSPSRLQVKLKKVKVIKSIFKTDGLTIQGVPRHQCQEGCSCCFACFEGWRQFPLPGLHLGSQRQDSRLV